MEGAFCRIPEGDGMVFDHAGGMVVRKQLEDCDTGCLAGFADGIE